MTTSRSVFSFICFTLLSGPVLSGQARSVAIEDQARDLKRTAHQLRISVEQVKNAREALQEATDLARKSQEASVFSQLTQYWTRLNRAQAPAALADLYAWLRGSARDARDAATYQRCTATAQSFLMSFAQLDAARALDLWKLWPDPPAALGSAAQKMRDQADKLMLSQLTSRAAVGDPEQSLEAPREQAAGGNDYAASGRRAFQLMQAGRRDEALVVVDQATADFKQREPDSRAVGTYLNFVRQLPSIDPSRFLQSLNMLLPYLEKQAVTQPGSPTVTRVLSVGDQTVSLTPAEFAVMEICRNSLATRPELALKTINSVPGLRNKLDQVGGFDNVMSSVRPGPDAPPLPVTSAVTMQMPDGTSRVLASTALNTASGPDLYQTLHGKAAKEPEFVREKLAEAAQNPDPVGVLIGLANKARIEDPDLALMALDLAIRVLMRVEPLQKRASDFQILMRAYRNCEGEDSADLMQEGLRLVQQLREQEKSAAGADLRSSDSAGATAGNPGLAAAVKAGRSPADQLEMAIVAELSLDRFNDALRYVRLMPDDTRLQAVLRIVQSLLQYY